MMEDDDISLTSTQVTEYSENDEFEVDRILAEKWEGDQKRYLLSWLGYPEDKHTWEPEHHIQDDEILETWQQRKRLEERGVEKSFDVQRWTELTKDTAKAKAERKRRRKQKRRRLGITVSPERDYESLSSDSESDEAIEGETYVEDVPELPKVQKKTEFQKAQVFGQHDVQGRASRTVTSPLDELTSIERRDAKAKAVEKATKDISSKPINNGAYAGTARPEAARSTKVSKRLRSRSESSPDIPIAKQPRREAEVPKLAPKSFTIRKRTPQVTLPSAQPNIPKAAAPTTRGGKTATRGGSALRGRRTGMTLIHTSANPDAEKKFFGNMRIGRKAQVQGRNLADNAPDLTKLGGLFDPSKPEDFQLNKSEIKNIRGVGDEEETSLFMGEAQKPLTGAFYQPPYQAPSKPAYDGRMTCFYYDRYMKGRLAEPCRKQFTGCTFEHEYRNGMPIALPPEGFREFSGSTKLVCYFWHKSYQEKGVGECSKGFTCSYWHPEDVREDMQVAPCPPGYRGHQGVDSYRSDEGMGHTYSNIAANESADQTTKTTTQPSQIRPAYNESWGTNAICSKWHQGACPNDGICPFVHSNIPGIPLQPGPAQQILRKPETIEIPQAAKPLELNRRASTTNQNLQPNERQMSEAEIIRRKSHETETTKANAIIKFRATEEHYATCYEWDVDRYCSRRSKCKYLHAYRDDAPLCPAKFPQSRDGTCPLWEQGDCWRLEKDCAYRHNFSPKDPMPSRKQESSLFSQVDNVSTGLDRLNAEALIRLPYLDVVDNIHDVAPPIPASLNLDPWKTKETCVYWEKGNCRYTAENCRYLHMIVNPWQQDEHPPAVIHKGRKLILKACRFWLHGHCVKSDDECEFLHYVPSSIDLSKSKRSVVPAGGDLLASLTRPKVRRAVTFEDETMPFFNEPEVDESPRDVKDPLSNPGSDQPRRTISLGSPQNLSHGPPVPLPSQIEAYQLFQSPTDMTNEISTEMDIDPVIVPKMKVVSFKDYQQKSQSKSATEFKDFTFAKSHAVAVDIRHMSQIEQPWAAELLPLPKIRFDHMCMAHDLEHLFVKNKMTLLWTSNLDPAKISETASSTIDLVMNELKGRNSGLVSAFSNFIVLVYPTASEWGFLNRAHETGQQETKLKFAIIDGELQLHKQKLISLIAADDIVNSSTTIPHRKAIVKHIYNLEFKKLLPPNVTTASSSNVFLIFPPKNKTEKFLVEWLHASCQPEMNLKVYSSQEEGAWEFFVKTISAGVVLVHESMIAEVCRIPYFMDCVKKTTAFWYIADSGSPYQMYPSYKSIEANPPLGAITTTLLLPHGHTFFLTPSLIITEPRRVIELIDWFFRKGGKSEHAMPGTWKMVVCHNFVQYAHDIALSKALEKQEFERIHRDEPACEQMLQDKGLDFDTCKARYLLQSKLVGYEAAAAFKATLNNPSDEMYSPIVYAPSSINPDDEKGLVEWFAFWALQRLDRHRKFTVIGTGDQTRALAFRGVSEEVPTVGDQVNELITDVRRRGSGSVSNLNTSTHHTGSVQPSPVFSPDHLFSARSPPLDSSSPMEIDSEGSSPFTGQGEDKKKVLVFEPTTRWYARLRKNGGPYEHVLVEDADGGLRSIGMLKTEKKVVVGKK